MRVLLSVFVLALVTMSLAACAANLGRLSVDPKVAQAFTTGEVNPDLQYYYSGRDTMPYAIIGIDRSYSVPSRYWVAFEPDASQLKKMSRNIYWDIKDYPYGATIIGPDGENVGVWYSNVYFYTVKVDPQERTVEILFVNPENRDQPG